MENVMMRWLVTMTGAAAALLIGCNKNADMSATSTDPYATSGSSAYQTGGYTASSGGYAASSGGYTAQPQAAYSSTPQSSGGGYYATTGATASTGGGGMYTVQRGDTLYSLARKFYGDQSRWRDIYAANQGVIQDPNILPVGTTLTMP